MINQPELEQIFLNVVDTAIEITGADFGNIQLLDPVTHDLKIVAYRGFPQFWLDYWKGVSHGKGCCGTALERGERVIVEDVTKSPIFVGTPALDIQLKAGVRAVQSTPLITRSGRALGMFSTHYRSPRKLSPRDLKLLDLHARLAADAIELFQLQMELTTAVATRDEFLSIASHELRTPLTSLKLQLQIIDRKNNPEGDTGPSPKDLARALGLALRQINSLNALVDDLLDTSRIHTGRIEFHRTETDLSGVVDSVTSQFAEQLQQANCQLDLDLERPLVGSWDSRRVEQIVANLLANVIKYAFGKPVRISTALQGKKAVLTVQDSGPGIPEDLHQRIFERFERGIASKHTGGLGLGLFIIKNIVDSKGGRIWVESAAGSGAKFVVELPLKPPKKIPASSAQ